jgi:hypothetical protein
MELPSSVVSSLFDLAGSAVQRENIVHNDPIVLAKRVWERKAGDQELGSGVGIGYGKGIYVWSPARHCPGEGEMQMGTREGQKRCPQGGCTTPEINLEQALEMVRSTQMFDEDQYMLDALLIPHMAPAHVSIERRAKTTSPGRWWLKPHLVRVAPIAKLWIFSQATRGRKMVAKG